MPYAPYRAGDRAIVTPMCFAPRECYWCTVVETIGPEARVKIDGDRIIRVFISQLKRA
jgi:hypothetical protein